MQVSTFILLWNKAHPVNIGFEGSKAAMQKHRDIAAPLPAPSSKILLQLLTEGPQHPDILSICAYTFGIGV